MLNEALKFIECDLPLDYNSINQLAKYSDYHFVLLKEPYEEVDMDKPWIKKKAYKYITTILNIHPNVVTLGHDFFRVNHDVIIAGYIPIKFEFPVDDKVSVQI